MALDVDGIALDATFLRHNRFPKEALPARRPGEVPDGRWQRGAVVDALYLADQEATTWAEWYRHLAETGVPPQERLPAFLWRWKVRIEVADLSDRARLKRVGLTPPKPGRKSWLRYQRIGEELWKEGWPGLLAPSAARPSGLVLCLFRTAANVPGATPKPPPRKITQVPNVPTGLTT